MGDDLRIQTARNGGDAVCGRAMMRPSASTIRQVCGTSTRALVLACIGLAALGPRYLEAQSPATSGSGPSPLSLKVIAYQRDGFTMRNESAKTVTGYIIDNDVGGGGGSFSSYDCYALPALTALPRAPRAPVADRNKCPIPPGTTTLMGGDGTLLFERRPRPAGVVFEDGSYEGDVRGLLDRRETEARGAEAMLEVVKQASAAADDATRVSLLRGYVYGVPDRQQRFGNWVELVQNLPGRDGRPPNISENLTLFAAYLERLRDEALRHQKAR